MTLVKNGYSHPYTPTVGGVLAPQQTADIGFYAQELDAIATGSLVVLDPAWVPPTTPPPPPGMGSWRGSVAEPVDLPASGNAAGDVFTVVSPSGLYVWDGAAWGAVSSGGGGGGGGGAVTPFRPETYGAVRNGVTDDTAAINACIQAAIAAAQTDGTNHAVVQFTAGIYQLSGAVTKNTTVKGNAQINLPVIATTGQKVVLELRGANETTELSHWDQTVVQTSGVVLRSSLTGQTYDATYGAPCIIGGPSYEQGFSHDYNGLYSNMMVVIDGITVIGPLNPTMHAVYLHGVAEVKIGRLKVTAAGTPSTFVGAPANGIWGSTPAPGNVFATGLTLPGTGNNALAEVDDYSCVNWTCAYAPGEHSHTRDFRAIYNNITLHTPMTAAHLIQIDSMLSEGHRTLIYGDPQYIPQANIWLKILSLRWESYNSPFGQVNFCYDPNNRILGEIHFTPFSAAGPDLSNTTGAAGVRFYDIPRTKAHPAPAVPASTTALRNVYWRDAMVTVTGGTVTAIAVDGKTSGLTSGSFHVPSWKTITLTYSVAPTWNWTLL